MLVKKAEVVPLEAIVRGYLTGTPQNMSIYILRNCKFIHKVLRGLNTRKHILCMAFLCLRALSRAKSFRSHSLHLRRRQSKLLMTKTFRPSKVIHLPYVFQSISDLSPFYSSRQTHWQGALRTNFLYSPETLHHCRRLC
jgi:hypothetical protein